MKHSWLAVNRIAVEAEREQCRAEGRPKAQSWGMLKALEQFPLEKYLTWASFKERQDLIDTFELRPDDAEAVVAYLKTLK